MLFNKPLEFFESQYARLIVRLWRRRHSLELDAIRRFQSVEADGVWHLHQVLPALDSPRERALVFQHLLEEDSHADLFDGVHRELSSYPLQPLHFERRPLTNFDELPWKTMIFIHEGEQRATRRFRALSNALDGGPLKRTLEQVLSDEEGHVILTSELAQRLNVETSAINRELWRIRMKRFNESLQQVVLRAANATGLWALMVGYWFFGLPALLHAKRKLQTRFVTFDNNRLKRFNT